MCMTCRYWAKPIITTCVDLLPWIQENIYMATMVDFINLVERVLGDRLKVLL